MFKLLPLLKVQEIGKSEFSYSPILTPNFWARARARAKIEKKKSLVWRRLKQKAHISVV